MVKISFIFSLIGLLVICGFRFYHRTDEITNLEKRADGEYVNSTEQVSPQNTASSEKPCGCCRKTLDKIRSKRKALEMWARRMITEHGYEAGMKRVMARSATLAKRVQVLLEKEKRDQMRDEVSSP